MPVTIQHSDQSKQPITILDEINNTQTSLILPGRKVSGYGTSVSQDLLKLLENFANTKPPANPIEGQLWYDSGANILNIWNNTIWVPAGNIHQGIKPATPGLGELWVDTANYQLNIYVGNDTWMLVGPQVSTINNQRYGFLVESIIDKSGSNHHVISLYIANDRVFVITHENFVPVNTIVGFSQFLPGLNVNSSLNFTVPINGNATSASSLLPTNGIPIPANNVLTTTQANIVKQPFSIQHNNGLTIGSTNAFNLSVLNDTAYLYNSHSGGIVLQTQGSNNASQNVLYVNGTNVGINTITNPSYALSVTGDTSITGNLNVSGSNTSITGNLNVSGSNTLHSLFVNSASTFNDVVSINNTLTSQSIIPQGNTGISTSTLGNSSIAWNSLYVNSINAGSITGLSGPISFTGSLIGNAQTASTLQNSCTFSLTGDVIGTSTGYNGSQQSIAISTSLSTSFVNNQLPLTNSGTDTDLILVYRSTGTSNALYQSTRSNFLGDTQVPIGSILPFAGINIPAGYLLCDGSEVLIQQYNALYNVIGEIYQAGTLSGVNTFRVPDLRGRFPLGKDSMNNNLVVPTASGKSTSSTSPVTRSALDTIGGSYSSSWSLALDATNAANTEIIDPFLMINYIIRSGMPAF